MSAGNPSTIVFACGCTSVLPIPETLAKATLALQDPTPGSTEVFDIEIVRVNTAPPVFIESLDTDRPEWARMCHSMIAIDFRIFKKDINIDAFEPMLAAWREKFGPMVPQCMLPDMLNGRGRFYGIWKHQVDKETGRRVGHLRVIDTPEPEVEPTPA